MKLGIIVGHTQSNQGAHSATLGQSEYPWNYDLAEQIERENTNLEVRTFLRNGVGIAGAYRASDSWGSRITVELHFNSSDNHRATGTGVLYYPGSENGRRLARLLFEEMDQVLGLGAWPGGSDGTVTPYQASGQARRGQTSLSAGRAPATLIEPFFGSNPTDSRRAEQNKPALARAIVKAAERYF